MMKRHRNHKESGFALVSALALIVVLSLVIASAVALTQYLSAEIDTFDGINRSYYAAESAVNRAILLLAQDRAKNGNRSLGMDSSQTQEVRFMADGRLHPQIIYGESISVQIFDAICGLDVSGVNPARQLLFTTTNGELKKTLDFLSNRLNDYVDADDLVRANSFERSGYRARMIPHLPRNRTLQFKEELRWIPGFKEHYPVSANGHFDTFRLIAPEKLRSLSGRPNLYSTPLSLLVERCRLNEREALTLKKALQDWQENGRNMEESLSPGLWIKLTTYFSSRESGIYTIHVTGIDKESPGATLTATLRIDASERKLEFYEYKNF